MGQFKEAVEGMSEACRAFDIAVTGGNVSFYNETEGASHLPDAGAGDRRADRGRRHGRSTPGFKDEGDAIILIGESKDELGGTEYLKVVHGREDGRAARRWI